MPKAVPKDMVIGSSYKNNAGLKFEILHYNSNQNVLIKFIESGYELSTQSGSIRRGEVRDKSSFVKVGDVFNTAYGQCKVLNVINQKKIQVCFNTGYITFSSYENLSIGACKDPYYPAVCGVGYIGEGKVEKSSYGVWNKMLTRCYDTNSKAYKFYGEQGVFVIDFWHNYQNFKLFYEEKYKEGTELDKDILISGNKLYGPDTCTFVPRQINLAVVVQRNKKSGLPSGVDYNKKSSSYRVRIETNGISRVLFTSKNLEDCFQYYKQEKETYVRLLADKYKALLTNSAYESLKNWNFPVDRAI